MRKSCPFTQNKHTLVLCAMFSRKDKIEEKPGSYDNRKYVAFAIIIFAILVGYLYHQFGLKQIR